MLLYLNIVNVTCDRTNFCGAKHYRYLDLSLDHEPSGKLFTLKYQSTETMLLLFLMQKDQGKYSEKLSV